MDCLGFPRDNGEQGARRAMGCTPAHFPLLKGPDAETEARGEGGLRQVHALADRLYVDLQRYMRHTLGRVALHIGKRLTRAAQNPFACLCHLPRLPR